MKTLLAFFCITSVLFCPPDMAKMLNFLDKKRRYENVLGRIQKGENLQEALESQNLTQQDWEGRSFFGIKE